MTLIMFLLRCSLPTPRDWRPIHLIKWFILKRIGEDTYTTGTLKENCLWSSLLYYYVLFFCSMYKSTRRIMYFQKITFYGLWRFLFFYIIYLWWCLEFIWRFLKFFCGLEALFRFYYIYYKFIWYILPPKIYLIYLIFIKNSLNSIFPNNKEHAWSF